MTDVTPPAALPRGAHPGSAHQGRAVTNPAHAPPFWGSARAAGIKSPAMPGSGSWFFCSCLFSKKGRRSGPNHSPDVAGRRAKNRLALARHARNPARQHNPIPWREAEGDPHRIGTIKMPGANGNRGVWPPGRRPRVSLSSDYQSVTCTRPPPTGTVFGFGAAAGRAAGFGAGAGAGSASATGAAGSTAACSTTGSAEVTGLASACG